MTAVAAHSFWGTEDGGSFEVAISGEPVTAPRLGLWQPGVLSPQFPPNRCPTPEGFRGLTTAGRTRAMTKNRTRTTAPALPKKKTKKNGPTRGGSRNGCGNSSNAKAAKAVGMSPRMSRRRRSTRTPTSCSAT